MAKKLAVVRQPSDESVSLRVPPELKREIDRVCEVLTQRAGGLPQSRAAVMKRAIELGLITLEEDGARG